LRLNPPVFKMAWSEYSDLLLSTGVGRQVVAS
jgi:hypothetical protein